MESTHDDDWETLHFDPTSIDSMDDFSISEDSEASDVVSHIVVPVVLGIIGIIGLLGNGLVVIVVVFNRQFHVPTNLLIANLSFTHILFVVLCMPFIAASYAHQNWIFGNAWCKISKYLDFAFVCSSSYTLLLMSVERFLVVVSPIGSTAIRTNRITIFAIIAVWLVVLLSSLPLFGAHKETHFYYGDMKETLCTFNFKEYSYFAIVIYFFLVSYAVPLIMICGLCVLRPLSQSLLARQSNYIDRSQQGEKSVTRLIIVVVAVFAFCWGPMQVIFLLHGFIAITWSELTKNVQIAMHVLCYVNYCVNPILYALLSENFGKAFRKFISRRQTIPRQRMTNLSVNDQPMCHCR